MNDNALSFGKLKKNCNLLTDFIVVLLMDKDLIFKHKVIKGYHFISFNLEIAHFFLTIISF